MVSPAAAGASATGSAHGVAASVHSEGVALPVGDAKRVVPAADADVAHSAPGGRAIRTPRLMGAMGLFCLGGGGVSRRAWAPLTAGYRALSARPQRRSTRPATSPAEAAATP